MKVELDLSNYATKSDLKSEAGVDTLQFCKKDVLADSKSDFDKLDIDKLEKVSSGSKNLKRKVDKSNVDKLALALTDLNKLGDEIIKNDVYDELVGKVNVIDTRELALKKQIIMLRSKRLKINV